MPLQSVPPPKAVPLATLMGLDSMLKKPPEFVQWIVSDRIATGSVNLLVAKPKVGKTTAARHLAVAVATGTEWLGSTCEQGDVWYFAFEGREADHLSHFRQFALASVDAARIQMYVDTPKPGFFGELMLRAKSDHPSLIIVDTLQRMLRVRSMEDYAEVTKAFDPIIQCARTTNTAFLLLHHAGKLADREALDTVLGSTAIAGSVDNTIVLAKCQGFRTVTTRQRVGPDLEECVIRLGADGRVQLDGSREVAERQVLMERLLSALRRANASLLRQEWLELVEGRRQIKVRAIAELVRAGEVVQAGTGKRGNPHVFSVPVFPCSDVPAVPEAGNRNGNDLFTAF